MCRRLRISGRRGHPNMMWLIFLASNVYVLFSYQRLKNPVPARALRGPESTAARALRGRPTASLTIKVP